QTSITGATAATTASGSVTISGTEHSLTTVTQNPASGSATVALSGTDASIQGDCIVVRGVVHCPLPTYDTGTITVTATVGGTAVSQQVSYGQTSTPGGMAETLAHA